MAWLRGKVALGSFPDLAGAVNKISESVKNIEKNFDKSLGLEGQPGDGSTSTDEASQYWSPELMAFIPQTDGKGIAAQSSKKQESSKKDESSKEKEGDDDDDSTNTTGQKDGKGIVESSKTMESSEKHESSSNPSIPKEKEGADADDSTKTTEEHSSLVRESSEETSKEGSAMEDSTNSKEEFMPPVTEASVETLKPEEHQDHPVRTNITIPEETDGSAKNPLDTSAENNAEKPVETNIARSNEETAVADYIVAESDSQAKPSADDPEESKFLGRKEDSESGCVKNSGSVGDESTNLADQVPTTSSELNEVQVAPDMEKSDHEPNNQDKMTTQEDSAVEVVNSSYDGQSAIESEPVGPQYSESEVAESVEERQPQLLSSSSNDDSEMVLEVASKDDHENAKVHLVNQVAGDDRREKKQQHTRSRSNLSGNADSTVELETLKKEMKNMETALLGAARQAQSKADEIAKLMNENEHLKSIIEEQKRKSNESEVESLREEYHQRVSTLERKVYALMRERDTLRKEANKRNDANALLKEKDEIISQVMAEGEELSKKQAVQESTIRRLRAQIRELEEEKKGLTNKLQVEENKVENLTRDKAATEKLLQETVEKNHAELATLKEFYTSALTAAKEEKAQAEARANDEARIELEGRLRETEEREAMLVQTLEELRQTLSRKEQQAVSREDMLRRDILDLQKRYQASERRCEELVLQVPESTRPLLRQITAMQEATARKAEAWAAVERSLNIRLQESEAKAVVAEERERSVSERLSKTLSRINVLEAQISCLRAEQTQLTRSLEKERQRASESRQDYLALKEEADTHKGHADQLKEEMRELKRKHKHELHEALAHRELLQQEIEREKAARVELEKTAHPQLPPVERQGSIPKPKSPSENGFTRRLSSASSLSSMEESFYLQASLDSSHTFSERSLREPTISPYYLKSMTPSAFAAALRQKEGELASYMYRLASMEAIRDSLSEELVKMTEECEKLRSEVALLPSIKAELEALRVRHSAALELMGERDEEVHYLQT
ncbi:hypothetical protein OSB04_004222 [Centaurea solstitialis]|uniref:TATA element modulatory factor 1 TATA binding domain-containing protein n=1 Tax=Centaurea solstitialis TaxID=347529 RepID=A0AA38U6U0_9ASTR|nr:hypothetical protein OSB04_004222 [Centaurea solstitialis]